MLRRHAPSSADCLGRTCLKWQSNGELSTLDLSLVLQRLQEVEASVPAANDPFNATAQPPCSS